MEMRETDLRIPRTSRNYRARYSLLVLILVPSLAGGHPSARPHGEIRNYASVKGAALLRQQGKAEHVYSHFPPSLRPQLMAGPSILLTTGQKEERGKGRFWREWTLKRNGAWVTCINTWTLFWHLPASIYYISNLPPLFPKLRDPSSPLTTYCTRACPSHGHHRTLQFNNLFHFGRNVGAGCFHVALNAKILLISSACRRL